MTYELEVTTEPLDLNGITVGGLTRKQILDFMESFTDESKRAILDRPDLGENCATALLKSEIVLIEIWKTR